MNTRAFALPVLGLLALAAWTAHACSSASYADGNKVVSARNMDFASLPPLALSWVPSGVNNPFIPVTGTNTYSTLGRSYKRKYNYVCISPARKLMFDAAALVFPLIKQVSIKNWPGVCNDGVNSAGLGMSLQWQLDTPGVPAYNKSQPGPAIDQGDVLQYILAMFGTVAELKAAFNNGLQITWNPLFRPASIIGFKKPYVPCHYGVWDRYNQSLVLEFGPNGLNVFTNTLGVFTNNPLFPQQMQYYNAWTTKITSPPYSVPPLNPTIHGTTFYPPPGSYNSSDRFTRLAVLKYAAGRAPWHAATDPISPGFALKSSSNPALITALDLIQSVYLPKGVDDSGGTGPKETDWTIFTTLRDHTKAVYYWRVANSPRWSKVSLRRVDWATLRSQKKVGARLMVGYPEWADDNAPLAATVPRARVQARRSVRVSAAASQSAPESTCDLECPLLRGAPGKTSCVHPGRPVSSACADCPRKSRMAAMAKSKCVHPGRPISQACPDCPRRK
ncbi:hypothetical protein CHLNCDRAFT_58529 [Chlorella variabilis]|uniref:Choloylglycine hydrolase/NAAA C-terminal domain-containing protein n=1 Tax=Chlorella variabilis TaxID=554065 RepID=E1ZKX1_CHLVA|nr:hypothetical protein CHLNCDRAFT_58529 [Chlorella variabilis]EFN53454.1 hypothetical protein CHLNCDRAFT_58529 [Chlorella variabilis]|eukprot:XP_005845556.1 hypothetical protein CHLNCDRAFT_58529 [Chlorella variabilis]